LPEGARWALDLVRAPAELDAAIGELLAGVVVVADLDAAGEVVRANAVLRAVTLAG